MSCLHCYFSLGNLPKKELVPAVIMSALAMLKPHTTCFSRREVFVGDHVTFPAPDGGSDTP